MQPPKAKRPIVLILEGCSNVNTNVPDSNTWLLKVRKELSAIPTTLCPLPSSFGIVIIDPGVGEIPLLPVMVTSPLTGVEYVKLKAIYFTHLFYPLK